MQVLFYDLKINPNNRFYDKAAYDSNLTASNVVFSVDLNREIVPNQVFYISRNSKTELNKLMQCTYIVYNINGATFGGFITNVQLLAPAGKKVAIAHSVDWWYYVLVNELEFDFHGNCERAHVNDLLYSATDECAYPDMRYTTTTAEAPISEYNKTIYQKALPLTTGVNVNNRVNSGYTFLYVYLNKIPSNWKLPLKRSILYLDYSEEKLVNEGFIFMFLLDVTDGEIIPFVAGSADLSSLPDTVYLPDIESTEILSMTTSSLFYRGSDYNITYQKGDKGAVLVAPLANAIPRHATLPSAVQEGAFKEVSWIGTENTCVNGPMKDFTIDSFVTPERIRKYTKKENYGDYLYYGIPKFRSQPYQTLTINGVDLTYDKLKNSGARVILSGDFQYYILRLQMTGEPAYTFDLVVNNVGVFGVDSYDDYWTRLNAKISTINAKQVYLSGKQAQYAAGQKVTNAVVSPALKFGEAYVTENPKAAWSGLQDVANMGTNIASGATQYQQGELLKQQGKLLEEIADKQMQDGQILSNSPSGLYTQFTELSNFSYTNTYLKASISKDVLIDLHRFGYNTFLQLDEIYFNHRREHFNYFKASDIEVTGLPLFMAQDIQNMFLSGVHLWQHHIEEFENGTNYQEGLWSQEGA